MKRLTLLISCLLLLFLFTDNGQTDIVHYTDDQGKVHYVNTNYSKVPEQYRSQVQSPPVTENESPSESQEGLTHETTQDTPTQEILPYNPDPETSDPFYTVTYDNSEKEKEQAEKENWPYNTLRYEDIERFRHGQQFDKLGFTKIPRVELFVSSKECDNCRLLEGALQARKILFVKFDIDNDLYGKKVYAELGGELPIAKVADTYIKGFKPNEVLDLIKEKSE